MLWPTGAVFGVVWASLFLPAMLVCVVWFWRRRELQPIRARSPALVIITDVILMAYTLLLCLQRIYTDEYPCILNLWSGYVGTIVLFNSYLWRCWTLYYNFNLAHVRLFQSEHESEEALLSSSSSEAEEGKKDEGDEQGALGACGKCTSGFRNALRNCSTKENSGGSRNFFLTHRHMTSNPYLLRINLLLFTGLMIAPIVLTSTRPAILTHSGDTCEKVSGPQQTILASYVAVYVAIFLLFAFSLRSVVDNFYIQFELKVTGMIAAFAVVPWYVFNNLAKTTNREVFPFSTLALLVAIVAAFAASTGAPLYASLYMVEFAPGTSSGRVSMYRSRSTLSLQGGISSRASSIPMTVTTGAVAVTNGGAPASPSFSGAVGPSSPSGIDGIPRLSSGTRSPSTRGSALALNGASSASPKLFRFLIDPEGAHCFKQFLTKEFSVENILFYEEIESFRTAIRSAREAGHDQAASRLRFVLEARKIHAKYIAVGSAYQVNLPDPVVRNCENHLRWEAIQARAPPPLPGQLDAPSGRAGRGFSMASSPPAAQAPLPQAQANPAASALVPGAPDAPPGLSQAPPPPQSPPMDHMDKTTPTLFDDAQRTIYILMEKDSMLRFVRSDLYREWTARVAEEERAAVEDERRKQVLAEMDLA